MESGYDFPGLSSPEIRPLLFQGSGITIYCFKESFEWHGFYSFAHARLQVILGEAADGKDSCDPCDICSPCDSESLFLFKDFMTSLPEFQSSPNGCLFILVGAGNGSGDGNEFLEGWETDFGTRVGIGHVPSGRRVTFAGRGHDVGSDESLAIASRSAASSVWL